jgi:L,D-transpeptidase ErfK/SrfK
MRIVMRWIMVGACALTASACAEKRASVVAPPASFPPLEKISEVHVRVSAAGELPPVVGRVQQYRIVPKDTLLDVARNADLGFSEVKDANREVDEWIPPPGRVVVVPTRWILPHSQQHGIVINIPEMRLYMFPQRTKPGEQVVVRTWPIAIGSDDTPSPVGPFTVISKDKNPTWYVPDSIYKTMDRPRHVVPPGPDNPMGEYRLKLSHGLYSIHGSNTPWAIGRETTHGCLRLYPEDLPVLYKMVKPPMSGEMVYEPVKVGAVDGHIYVEVHDDVYHRFHSLDAEAKRVVGAAHLDARVDPDLLRAAVRDRSGVPIDVTRGVAGGPKATTLDNAADSLPRSSPDAAPPINTDIHRARQGTKGTGQRFQPI